MLFCPFSCPYPLSTSCSAHLAAHILSPQAVLPIQLPTSSLNKLFCPFSCPHPLSTSCSAHLAAHILSPQAVLPIQLPTSSLNKLFCPLGRTACGERMWAAKWAEQLVERGCPLSTSCSAHWAAAQILSQQAVLGS